ncbi:MAG: TetR/AcrR family transcriptional regulator C-terminal domain-containing protein [Oscillospiraceae bacterium]|nr:TetR/AcrR family transcriptional regulator C-terminal domain-containing protein [Oscillospiraceae bacterium]
MDKRIIKTERAFTQALFHFLNEKELNKITVKELCDYAEMNRGTFYLHYIDIYDLMDKTEQKMVDRIYSGNHSELRPINDSLLNVFDYIKRHKEEYKTLIVKHLSFGFINKLSDKILAESMPIMEKLIPDVNEETLKNASYFYVGGAVALLRGWLENDCAIPCEELLNASIIMAEYIYKTRIKNELTEH